VARSPLYSIFGETIAGAPILRAFGASSKFLRDMLRCADTVSQTELAFTKSDQRPLEYKPVLLAMGWYVERLFDCRE
jgi:hypothetical protein